MQGNVSIGGSVTPSKALEVGGSVSINGQLRIGEVGGGSTPAAGRVLTSLDGSGNASWKPGIEVAIGGANSTQVCSLTPNKRFLVTAYGKALVPGNGASTLVVNANGVIGQDNLVGIPNNYDKFVVPIVTNSDSSGCINYNAYISGGPGGNVTIMNVSIVG